MGFIDFKKAYDLVPHQLVFNKLYKKGFGEKFVNAIKSLYKGTKLRVRVGKELSESFDYERGVRQGCPTSPLLFDIFIDDLLDKIGKIIVPRTQYKIQGICFADDTLIMARSCKDLNYKLTVLEDWLASNGMEVNANKCGVMVIPNRNDNSIVRLGNEVLPRVSEYTYLGIQLNDELNMERMARYRIPKGNQVLDIIWKTLAAVRIPLLYKLMLIKGIQKIKY